MYNAMRAGTPILVTAGQHHSRYLLHEPILWGDLVGLAKPVTKWAYEPRSPGDLQLALPRALKEAATPPAGPVFLSLPSDVLWQETELPASPVAHVGARTLADPAELRRAAEVLRGAARPLILAGDGVDQAGAQAVLGDLAEWLGAGVVTEPLSTEVNFRTDHPLFLGQLVHRPEAIQAAFSGVDCVLLCGFTAQGPLPVYDDQPLFPSGVRLAYLHHSAHEIAKIYPGEACVWGDVKRSVEALTELLRTAGEPPAEHRRQRLEDVRHRAAARRDRQRRDAEAAWDARPISAQRMMGELRRAMDDLPRLRGSRPEEAIIVNEAITNTPALQAQVERTLPGTWIAGKGGGLGHSMGTAFGVQVAAATRRDQSDRRRFLPLLPAGALDGGALPAAGAVPVGQQRQLSHPQAGHDRIGRRGGQARSVSRHEHRRPARRPPLRGASYGARGVRVERPGELGDALRVGLSGEGPALVEVVIDPAL